MANPFFFIKFIPKIFRFLKPILKWIFGAMGIPAFTDIFTFWKDKKDKEHELKLAEALAKKVCNHENNEALPKGAPSIEEHETHKKPRKRKEKANPSWISTTFMFAATLAFFYCFYIIHVELHEKYLPQDWVKDIAYSYIFGYLGIAALILGKNGVEYILRKKS